MTRIRWSFFLAGALGGLSIANPSVVARSALAAPPVLRQSAPCAATDELAYSAPTTDATGREYSAIYVTCADGTGRRQLTDANGNSTAPAWSPDGRLIAFQRGRVGGKLGGTVPDIGIYIMNADGSSPRRVVARFGSSPTWSPDGTQLAFISLPDVSPADSADINRWSLHRHIFVVRPDGTGLRQVTADDGSHNYPAWSPDGRQIAFSGGRREGEDWAEIYVVNVDGSGTKRLTFNRSGVAGCCEDAAPAWSPDSRWLAFVSKRDGNSEIYKMRRDGSEQTRVTKDPIFDGYPGWSANGTSLVYAKHRAAPQNAGDPARSPDSLYVISTDGRNRRPLGIAGSRPAWRWR